MTAIGRIYRRARRLAARLLRRSSGYPRRLRAAVARESAHVRSLAEGEKAYLVRLARETLLALAQGREVPSVSDAPASLSSRGTPTQVFCTLRQNGRTVGCIGCRSLHLAEAVVAAVRAALQDRRFGDAHAAAAPGDLGIELSVLGGFVPLERVSWSQLSKVVELGVHAIQLRVGARTATFKASVPVHHRYELEKTLESLGVKSGAGTAAWHSPAGKLSLAHELHLVEAHDGRGFFELRRGLLAGAAGPVTRERLLDSLRAGAGWLMRNQREDGSYNYLFEPERAAFSDSDNLVRQAGTAFGLAAVGVFLGERGPDDSARRCIEYLLSRTEYQDAQRTRPYIRHQTTDELGSTALTLLAILHLADPAPYEDAMGALGRSITTLQDDCGQLRSSFSEPACYYGQSFFPGEALFALSALCERTEAPELRRCIEKAFGYYPDSWRHNKDSAFVPWQTHAAYRMYRLTGERSYADFALEMNDWLLDQIWTEESSPDPDCVGGIGRPRPGLSTGTLMEGIAEAYALAQSVGDGRRAERYRTAIVRAAEFLLRLQFKDKEAYYLPAESRASAIGGFRLSLTDHALRIDGTQHCLIALLNMLQHVDGTPWSAAGRG